MLLKRFGSVALLLGALFSSPLLRGAETNDTAFLKRVYTNAVGQRLPYRVLVTGSPTPATPVPLIVFLHGAIARGEDNQEPLNWGPRLIRESLEKSHAACVLLVPQCPKSTSWYTSGGRTLDALRLTVELIETNLAKEFHVDGRRRYLTGVSMGGIGLWGYLSEHPGYFAAGVPVCAAGTPSRVTQEAARFPIWAFHSDDDHLIPVQSARDMVQAWKSKGGVARYTEYTGLKHSSWKKAYLESELYPWLFKQTLP